VEPQWAWSSGAYPLSRALAHALEDEALAVGGAMILTFW